MLKLFTIIAAYLGAFFTPIQWSLAFVVTLVFFDSMTGVMAARKRKERITSNGFRRAWTKALSYSLGIIIARGLELMFDYQIPFSSIAAGIVVIIEAKSNYENIAEVTGIDIWSKFINHLQGNKGLNK